MNFHSHQLPQSLQITVLKSASLILVLLLILSPLQSIFAQETEPAPDAVAESDTPTPSSAEPLTVSNEEPSEVVADVQPETTTVGNSDKDQKAQLRELDQQLKQGEITQEEYDQRKAELLLADQESAEMSALQGPEIIEPEAQTQGKYIAPRVSGTDGSLEYQFPIALPPGRDGLTPSLSLVHNSSNQSLNSLIGKGWSFNIPYIQTQNKYGVEQMYDSDDYFSSIDGELINQGGGLFTPRTETGSFIKYQLADDVWTLTDKTGTKYVFGSSTVARQDNPSDSSQVFTWMLEQVEDLNGNTISYEYYKNQGQIYPEFIKYNNDELFEVEFVRSTRSPAPTGFQSGFAVKNAYEITSIEVNFDGSLVSKYDIASTDSLVDGITPTGYGVTTDSLPTTEFLYTSEADGVGWGGTKYATAAYADHEQGQYTDLNGDGLVDFISSSKISSSEYVSQAYINSGSGFSWDTSWDLPVNGTNKWYFYDDSNSTQNDEFQLVDINGDGYADVVEYNASLGRFEIFYNTGSGWSSTISNSISAGPDHRSGRFVDINGDGVIDFLQATKYGGYNGRVYINNGTGFTWDQSWDFTITSSNDWYFYDFDSDQPNHEFEVVDINEDGLVDISSYNSSLGRFDVFYNDGTGWDSAVDASVSSGPDHRAGRYVDLNGDGLLDFITSTRTTGGDYVSQAYINNGTSFTYDSDWNLPVTSSNKWYFYNYYNDVSNPEFILVDGTGDGLADISDDNANMEIYANLGTKHNLLSEITNANGGVIDFTYTTAQKQDGSNDSPGLITVVETMRVDDLINPRYTTEYEYKDASFYYATPHDRKFAGFGEVTKVNADDTKIVTKYHQGNGTSTDELSDSYAKIGKVYKETIFDSADDVFEIHRYNYGDNLLGTTSTSTLLASQVTLQYDGTTSHTDTAVAYEYDSYGNIVSETQYGEVNANTDGTFSDTGSDARFRTIAYNLDTVNYNVSQPAVQTLLNNSSSTVTETRFAYDTTGNLLETGRWIAGANFATTTWTYDTNGLVLTEADPLNNVTTYAYDTYDLYPATTTNELNHETIHTYDYSSGKMLTATDPNGKITSYTYDGLDRLTEIEETQGNGGIETTKTLSYTTSITPHRVTETRYRDGSDTTEVRSYYDGLGRLVQQKTEFEEGWETVTTAYDDLGRVESESLPYVKSSGSHSSAAIEADLLTTYSYDPLGRVVAVTNARGTTDTEYDGFTSAVTDPLNNDKSYTSDAYGNLVQVDEENGVSTYTTLYEYSADDFLIKLTDAENNVRNFTHDGLGRMTQQEDLHTSGDSTFGVWDYVYDDINLTSVSDPEGDTTTYTYDDLNRVLTENSDSVAGTEIAYVYDSCTNGTGKLCSVTTPDVSSAYTYWKQGLVEDETVTIDATVYTKTLAYNRQGQPTTITQPNSDSVSFEYDDRGLPSLVSVNGTTTATTIYGIHRKPVQVAYASGVVTDFGYDETDLYSLSSKYTGAPTSVSTTTVITSTTTEVISGEVVEVFFSNFQGGYPGAIINYWTSSGGNWYQGNDTVSNPISSGSLVGTSGNCDWFCYLTSKDPIDLSTASSAELSLWRWVSSAMDSGEYGKLELYNGSSWVTVSNWADDNTWYFEEYDLSDYLVSNFKMRFTNRSNSSNEKVEIDDVKVTVTYPDTVETTVSTSTGTTTLNGYVDTLQALEYEYDAAGNIISITDTSDTETAKTQTFAYDDLYRLTSVTTTDAASGTSPYTQTFAYSPIGNITNFNGTTLSYADNGYNNPFAVTGVGSTTHSYDNNGNLTNDGTWTHGWDYRNRLVSSGDGSNSLSYTYNHQNERAKLVDGTDTTIYPFSDYQISSGTPKLYLSLGDMTVATVEGATTTFIHTDHLGGTTLTSDSSGAITSTLDYFPYGETRIDIGTHDEDTQFTGYKKDSTTGLNYASARYYNPARGAFISQDPVALALGNAGRLQTDYDVSQETLLRDPQLLNAYGYARNNPLKYNDPTGEMAVLAAPAVMPIVTAVSNALLFTARAVILAGATLVVSDQVSDISSTEIQTQNNDLSIDTHISVDSNPYANLGFPPPSDPNDFQPPRNNAPKWQKISYALLLGGAAAYEVKQQLDDHEEEVSKLQNQETEGTRVTNESKVQKEETKKTRRENN